MYQLIKLLFCSWDLIQEEPSPPFLKYVLIFLLMFSLKFLAFTFRAFINLAANVAQGRF